MQIFLRAGGNREAPALLLLHGFPQTHVMWHRVAQLLKDHFFLVIPDLRGYGDSSHAPGLSDHSNYSKRAMAGDMAFATAYYHWFHLVQPSPLPENMIGGNIRCDTLVLWGEQGVVQRFFDPLALWQAQCSGTVSGGTLPVGHFIPEQLPSATSEALRAFFV